MKTTAESVPSRANPLVLLGTVTLAGTAVTAAVALGSATPIAVAAQSTLPAAIGVAMVVYGRYRDTAGWPLSSRVVYRWTGLGLLSFFLIGFWFGQVSRLFATSFLLAVYASLATGAALGCLVGVYAARLRRANAELEQQTERLAGIASIVSHDLRNPLNVAQGRVDLARESRESRDGEGEPHLETADRALDRMETLVDDLLTLTRGEERVDDLEPVALGAVARRSWTTVDTGDADLRVRDDAVVEADPTRLRQVFENLFGNAVEHGSTSPPSHGREDAVEHGSTGESATGLETVRVGTLADGTGFFVEDDGTGIPPDERETVFETGYTTDEGGTGLGLAIVASVAEAHDWSVAVTESADGGARFEFTGATVRPAADADDDPD